MQYGKFLLAPMTLGIANKSDFMAMQGEQSGMLASSYSAVCGIVYIFSFGWMLAIGVGICALFTACTIVGLPVAIVLANSLPFVFNPVGKVCLNSMEMEAVRMAKINRMSGIGGQNININMNIPRQ